MDVAPTPDPAGESARILHVLRHALADPLSAATLKLDLVERRLTAASGVDPSWVAERVRAAQTSVGTTNRLLDLLLRLAEIAGERPCETSLADVCASAGVSLDEPAVAVPRLSLRPRSAAEAIRIVAAFASRDDLVPSTGGRIELGNGRVTLSFDGSPGAVTGNPERLLALPHGVEEAEPLFVARAAAAADGGFLELTERDGRLVALFSWPLGPETRRRAGARGVKVLVVEDEPGVRIVARRARPGARPRAVRRGLACPTPATPSPALAPDVCITDLGLPDGSGLDVVRAAKTARPDCDVLVLTGKGSILAAVEAMRAGAHDFLLKPLKPALLASTLARLSEHRSPHPAGRSRAAGRGSARRDGRPVGRDAGGLPPDRARGALRSARDDHRGERHRQGGRGPHGARAVAPRPGARSSRSTAGRSRRTSSRASSSDTRRGRSPERSGAAPARSRWPTGEPFSSTR